LEQNNPNYSNQPQQSNNFGQQQQQFQNQNQGNYQFPHQGDKLPGDPIAITLGIISLVVFLIGCWCYGVIAIFTLIISIIGLVVANKSMRLYKSDPSRYSQSTERSVSIGKILNIIGVVISGIVCLFLMILLLFFGSLFWGLMNGEYKDFEDFNNRNNESIFDYDEESGSEDGWKYYEEEEELDSLETDSTLQIEEITKEETEVE
jgi:nitrogen fixation-related uncharacterized protein